MNVIAEFNGIASRWGMFMVNSLQGGLIAAGLALGITFLFRRRLTPRAVSGLWLLVLVRVLLPFTVSVPVLDPVPLPVAPPAGEREMPAPDAGADTLPAVSAVRQKAVPAGISATGAAFAAWLVIAGAGFVRLAVVARRTARVVRMSRPADPGHVPVDTAAVAALVGLRRNIPVRISGVPSPAVAGLWSPVLLLPEGLRDQLSVAQWRWTIAHELLHIRRRDLWVQAAQAVIGVLFFFHPAVWLASWMLNSRREEICDAGAAALTQTAPRESAAGFLTILEWAARRHRVPLATAGMSGSHRRARQRIGRLLDDRSGVRPGRLTAVVAALAGGTLLLLPGIRPVRAAGSVSHASNGTDGAREAQLRIEALESRVAELENELRTRSGRTLLREKAEAAARDRAARDAAVFTSDQLHELEQIYQAAKKQPTYERIAAAMQPLLDRFPGSNRAGCAALYVGRGLEGEARRQWLMHAAEHGRDCLFLDGTSAGGLARILLAADCAAAGDAAGARRFLAEVHNGYPDSIDFDGILLTDRADEIDRSLR